MTSRWSTAALAAAFAILIAAPAAGEIIVLSSGRTLSVKGHRFEGDTIVLTLRTGGEVTCDKTIVEKVLPDEVPYPEPKAAAEEDGEETTQNLESTPYGEIIAAVSEVESNYKPKARSPRGAMGLMQLMPSTAREYKVRNPFDPKANIEAGIKHLKGLIDRFGVELALAAYNAGEGAVVKFNGVPPYRETRNYVSKILSLAGLK